MNPSLSEFLHDLQHRRYRFRQIWGAAFAIFLVFIAEPTFWLFVTGAVLCGLGEAIRVWAAGYIRKSQKLETRGPYGYVRHPQYSGNALIALGVALASGHLWAIPVWVLFFLVFYRAAILREDDKLHRRFGEDWEEWKSRTHALVPTRLRSAGGGVRLADWSLRRCFSNGEPAWLLLIALGLAAIHIV